MDNLSFAAGLITEFVEILLGVPCKDIVVTEIKLLVYYAGLSRTLVQKFLEPEQSHNKGYSNRIMKFNHRQLIYNTFSDEIVFFFRFIRQNLFYPSNFNVHFQRKNKMR